MSWRDPNWVYQPAATHGDLQAFAQRQRERAQAADEQVPNMGAAYFLHAMWEREEIIKNMQARQAMLRG